MARDAAPIAGLDMAAQRCRATGNDGAPDLDLGCRQFVRRQIGRAVTTQDGGQTRAGDSGTHACRSDGGQVEQFQRRRGAGDVAMREMEIAHGGRDMAMAQQPLQRGQIHAGFQ